MRKKRKKSRRRGGVSHPCPECGGASHVVITRREGTVVARKRECLKCDHVFRTREVAA